MKWREAMLLLFMVMTAAAPAKAEDGYEIASKADKVMFDYETLTAMAEMTLYKGDRADATRRLNVSRLETEAEKNDRGRLKVTAPVSLEGTILLSWSNALGDQQQWLYMPRTGRVRRIGDRGRESSFVNSDYTYEDMLTWQLDTYRYTYQGRADCGSGRCFVNKAVPTDVQSAYGRMLVYYDDKYRFRKVEYFRPDGSEVWKRQIFREYTQVGDTWQPTMTEMVDEEAGTRTIIEWSDYKGGADLQRHELAPNSLGR